MASLKEKLYEIIFEADTRAGKNFDIVLLIIILLSVMLVLLESVSSIRKDHHEFLVLMEWIITVIFTVEYIVRIIIVNKPWKYITSFYGIIDFLSVIPTYLGLLIAGYQSLLVIRVIRLMRISRIFKLTRYSSAGRTLTRAIWASREKISVFLFSVLMLVTIVGTLMYLIEGEESGFTSIPQSIYWGIVTLTTVGYGDISPVTPLGQFLASIVMITGYAIIAVPTGIVTAEMINLSGKQNTEVCPNCMYDEHDDDAIFCKKCGTELNG
jgi:voltage-gated potassium channel